MQCAKENKTWERVIRVLAGAGLLIFAYSSWGLSNAAVIAGAVGLMLVINGLLGGCPVCAIARSRIDKGD
ncbi:YgaP family membrane protein [Propionivibrio dicarboxylicus]|uniref:Inner membrane protein YgaP-like transmembrane domain-containing protein n=1 Tax=Propionivibrio dicarboxylicus TaxID=83767 RepID=A0A1G8EW52_9RHOO|nr:DUF2892 domain-containing protein [Propionivibrio dicarboxylicus]SDH74131.1 Protein of unknown function [Propionivibrio dicarboxylicus]